MICVIDEIARRSSPCFPSPLATSATRFPWITSEWPSIAALVTSTPLSVNGPTGGLPSSIPVPSKANLLANQQPRKYNGLPIQLTVPL